VIRWEDHSHGRERHQDQNSARLTQCCYGDQVQNLCLDECAIVQMPVLEGGLYIEVVWFDTLTFHPNILIPYPVSFSTCYFFRSKFLSKYFDTLPYMDGYHLPLLLFQVSSLTTSVKLILNTHILTSFLIRKHLKNVIEMNSVSKSISNSL
jgi:hypothetical protein